MSASPTDRLIDRRRQLLWVDCSAGAVVGVAMFTLGGWLSEWYEVPKKLLYFMGVANLAYATYSFSLARRSVRPMALIVLLVVANLTWAVVCLRWAVVFNGTATLLGVAHFVLEALFVGGLGCLEWRWRDLLLRARDLPPKA